MSDPRDELALIIETEPPAAYLQGIEVHALLRMLPGVGPERAARLLERAGIGPLTAFGRLDAPQRAVLAHVLRASR